MVPQSFSLLAVVLLLHTLELVLDVPKDLRKSIAILERSNDCLLGEMPLCDGEPA